MLQEEMREKLNCGMYKHIINKDQVTAVD